MSDASSNSVLGLDVGGANLKASDGAAFTRSVYFPLWKHPQRLADALVDLTRAVPACGTWAVTMTGELADCFRTKREGVAAILDAVEQAASRAAPVPQIAVYLTDGTFVSPGEARARPLEASASNWHALAALVARRFAQKTGVLIDVGSTTCDIIPFAGGTPTAQGRTDPERLATGELVYTGVVRSPLCAIAPTLPWRGQTCRTAQELFATTLDAYLTFGLLPEDSSDLNTADGRPATIDCARDRLARSICADCEMFDAADAFAAATTIRDAQVRLLAEAWLQVVGRQAPSVVVVSGQGEFLAREVLKFVGWAGAVVSYAYEFGGDASRIGPAFALARLAQARG